MTSIAEAIGKLLHAEKDRSNSSLSLIRACASSTDMEAEVRAVFRANGWRQRCGDGEGTAAPKLVQVYLSYIRQARKLGIELAAVQGVSHLRRLIAQQLGKPALRGYRPFKEFEELLAGMESPKRETLEQRMLAALQRVAMEQRAGIDAAGNDWSALSGARSPRTARLRIGGEEYRLAD